MDKEQEIYLGRFLTFENTVTQHEAKLAKWPEVLAARNLISAKKGVISGLTIVQGQGATQETGFKTALREKLNDGYADVVKAIEANIGDHVGLQARYKKIMPSDLRIKRDTEVESEVKAVVADAKSILPKLERSDVTLAQLEEMTTLAANYSKLIGEKGTASDLSTQATADLEKVFNEVNVALRDLKEVINGMPDSLADVQAALQAALKVSNV